MKKIIKVLFLIIGFAFLFGLAVNLIGTRRNIVAGVTGEKIKRIRPGWKIEQVVAVLGKPYKIDASQGLHTISCKKSKPRLDADMDDITDIRQVVTDFYNDTTFCCEGNKEDLQTVDIALTYTRPVELSKNYPMLWIHLDSSFQVYSIYAKQYDGLLGLDDPSIYNVSWKFDAINMKTKNSIESYIDEPKFSECFE